VGNDALARHTEEAMAASTGTLRKQGSKRPAKKLQKPAQKKVAQLASQRGRSAESASKAGYIPGFPEPRRAKAATAKPKKSAAKAARKAPARAKAPGARIRRSGSKSR
jgi:hypothetical protein